MVTCYETNKLESKHGHLWICVRFDMKIWINKINKLNPNMRDK